MGRTLLSDAFDVEFSCSRSESEKVVTVCSAVEERRFSAVQAFHNGLGFSPRGRICGLALDESEGPGETGR